jgi:hypothetical protein
MYGILGFSRKFCAVIAHPLQLFAECPYTNFPFSSKSGPGKGILITEGSSENSNFALSASRLPREERP